MCPDFLSDELQLIGGFSAPVLCESLSMDLIDIYEHIFPLCEGTMSVLLLGFFYSRVFSACPTRERFTDSRGQVTDPVWVGANLHRR